MLVEPDTAAHGAGTSLTPPDWSQRYSSIPCSSIDVPIAFVLEILYAAWDILLRLCLPCLQAISCYVETMNTTLELVISVECPPGQCLGPAIQNTSGRAVSWALLWAIRCVQTGGIWREVFKVSEYWSNGQIRTRPEDGQVLHSMTGVEIGRTAAKYSRCVTVVEVSAFFDCV